MGKILITGAGGPAGRSAIEYFGSKGHETVGADARVLELKAGDFALMPLASDEGYDEALLDIIRRERPGLFVPTVTEELLKASLLKREIEGLGCAVFISPPAAVEVANDKLKTALFMEAHSVAVPRTFHGETPREAVLKGLALPFLSKPVFGRGGRGVTVYRTEEEFLAEKRAGIIYQEFIPGTEYDINIFIDKSGAERAAVALEKTAMKEGIVGNALGVRRVENEGAVDVARKAARLLKMEGPLDFDVRLRADGTPALLEINARLGGNSLSAPEVLEGLEEAFLEACAGGIRVRKT